LEGFEERELEWRGTRLRYAAGGDGSPLVLVQGDFFLKDDNNGLYGNPLLVDRIDLAYSDEERGEFRDFWTGEAVDRPEWPR